MYQLMLSLTLSYCTPGVTMLASRVTVIWWETDWMGILLNVKKGHQRSREVPQLFKEIQN